MTDTANKGTDAQDAETAEAIIIESEPQKGTSSAPKVRPSRDKSQDQVSGGGFVWLLVIFIVIGGGGYAAWPYFGHHAEPYIEQAREMLGMKTRPMGSAAPRPAMPSAAAPERLTTAPTPTPASEFAAKTPLAEAPTPVPTPAPIPAVEPTAQPAQMPEPMMAPARSLSLAEDLERRLSALENKPQPDASSILNSLATRLDVLETQLNAVASAPAPTFGEPSAQDVTDNFMHALDAMKAEIAALKTRLNAIENTPRGLIDPSASAQALVLSVAQLQTRVSGSGPFAAELDALQRIAGSDPVIATAVAELRPFGATGVATLNELTANFKLMAAEVMRAHGRTDRSGWWAEVSNTLSGLVTVRRTDPARIDDPVERALAVAEHALGQNDLKTAVGSLGTLQGPAGDAANAWRTAARARVDVQTAIDALHNRAVAALSTTGGV